MQIGGVNSLISQLASLFQKKNTSESTYTPPSGEISISSILEKLSIDKKTEAKKQEAERMLTGFGKKADSYIKRVSEAAGEIYRATLENELKTKIKEMSQKEQANRVATYQMANAYQNVTQTSSLNLYS